MSRRVLLAVTHLLGTGHLARTALIAGALARRGVDVVLASGGMPVPGLDPGPARLVQLPPLRAADATFTRLLDAEGREADDDLFARRRQALLGVLGDARPHIVVVEQYPFGRRKLAAEFAALLAAARALVPPAVTVGSVRDVLTAQADPARLAAMAERARAELDAVLVHGDPCLIPFEASFPPAPAIADRLVYTGYVAATPVPRAPGGPGEGEIVVSAGGGAVGIPLYRAALGAARMAPDVTWRILVGRGTTWRPAEAPGNAIVEPNRPDFRALLANCRVSVSQGGYNTVVDVLAARARGVIVPFAGDGETEQTLRASRLAARGLVELLDEAVLAPASLAAAVRRAMTAPEPDVAVVALDGAGTSAALLESWATLGHADLERAR